MTRLALVGVGRWGRKLLGALAPRSDVVVCHAGSAATRDWLAVEHPQLQCAAHYRDVLADPGIEGVVIATPLETHAELTFAALEAGKHVFVEKPLATSVASAEQLVDLARRHARVLFVGHVFSYHAAFDSLLARLGGAPASWAHLGWHKLGTFDSDLVWNLAVHQVSLALSLFGGPPTDVSPVYRRGLISACDVLVARLEFAGGRDCWIEINRVSPHTRKLSVVAPAAGPTLLWDDDLLYSLRSDGELDALPLVEESALEREVDAFLGALGGSMPRTDAQHGLEVVRVAARLTEAA